MNTVKVTLLLFVFTGVCSLYAGLELIGNDTIDLGNVFCYETRDVTYKVINNGTTDILIRGIVPTCACMEASKDQEVIRVGEEYEIKAHFNARTVHGVFTRGVWLETNDKKYPRIFFKVTGEVISLFKGLPEQILTLQSKDENTTFTNKFTITGLTTNFFIGKPKSDDSLALMESTLVKDKEKPNTTHLTIIIKPKNGKRILSHIDLPVTGPEKVEDLQIRYNFSIGVPLRASPSKLVVVNREQTFSGKFFINTCSANNSSSDLEYHPQIKGLEIVTKAYSRKSLLRRATTRKSSSGRSSSKNRYTCTTTITPEALKKIFEMETPGITFHCSGHKPVTIPLISSKTRETVTAQRKNSRVSLRQRGFSD